MRFMVAIVACLGLSSATFGQINATTLRLKYGAPIKNDGPANTETFRVRSNIEMLVNYGGSGQVCRIGFPQSEPMVRQGSADAETNRQLYEVLDDLVPPSMRGKELPSGRGQIGLASFYITEYENLTILGVGPQTIISVTFKNEGCGGGRGDRLPRTDSSAHNDPAPGQSDDRGVYRSGGDVTAPVLLHRTNPGYTEQARTAKYQGTVLLSVEIDPSGTPTNIKVQRGLGLGLNEKAIEAVKQWKFKPGQRDGTDVSVRTTVEVIFRLQ